MQSALKRLASAKADVERRLCPPFEKFYEVGLLNSLRSLIWACNEVARHSCLRFVRKPLSFCDLADARKFLTRCVVSADVESLSDIVLCALQLTAMVNEMALDLEDA